MRAENDVGVPFEEPPHAALALDPQFDEAGVDDFGDLVERAHMNPLRWVRSDDCEAHVRRRI